jgi:hypothetical protein
MEETVGYFCRDLGAGSADKGDSQDSGFHFESKIEFLKSRLQFIKPKAMGRMFGMFWINCIFST